MNTTNGRNDQRRTRLLAGIPESCGVYIFRNVTGSILYVGKAVNLRRRVMQYFSRADRRPGEIKDSLAKYIEAIEWIPCETELHALLLEDELIKSYRPPYNTKLKKCLQYAYIGIADEPYPDMALLDGDGADAYRSTGEVFGPFLDEFTAARVMDLVHTYLLIRGCTGPLPSSPCMRKDIGVCSAPCTHSITGAAYAEAVRRAKGFLSGADSSILEIISSRMFALGSGGEYEQAARARDNLYYAGDFMMKIQFYAGFRNGSFLLHAKGRWEGTFLFTRGELVLYTRENLDAEDCRKFLDTSRLPEAPAPDAVLFDRAAIVSSWSRRDAENRTLRSLDAETA